MYDEIMATNYLTAIIRKPLGSRALNAAGKRIVDLFIAFFGLLLVAPFFAFIAWRVKRDSPGPVFYWGTRSGLKGKRFQILKFRTMYDGEESKNGPKITGQGDARITSLGQWLRDTKINELPQLWNVFVGDMSLVGPRPEDPDIVSTWPEEIRKDILSVRPGITSPASIVFRDEEQLLQSDNIMDDYLRTILPSKLRLDQLYVRNYSLLADLDVIFWTFMVLIPRARSVPIPEAQLYWGPFSFFFSQLFNWFIGDFVISMTSVAVVAGIWRTITPLDIGWRWGFISAIGMAVIFSLFNVLLKNHLVYWRKASPRQALDVITAAVLSVTMIWIADKYFVRWVDIPDGLYIVAGFLACAGFIAARYRERILTGLAWRWFSFRRAGGSIGERVLIVGAGDMGSFAAWLVRKSDLSQAFTVVGLVDDDPRMQNMNYEGIKILGSTRDIPQLVAEHDPGLILFAISNINETDRRRILNVCKKTGVRVVLIPDIMKVVQSYFREASVKHDETPVKSPPADIDRVDAQLEEVEQLILLGELEDARVRLAEIRASLFDQIHV